MKLRFPHERIAALLAILAVALALLHIIGLGLDAKYDNRITELLVEKFSLEGEGNIPAFFSASLLLFTSVLFLIIGWAKKNSTTPVYANYWLGLGVVFLFLSLDEAAQIHEKLDTDLIWGAYESTGLLAWPWVIIYGGLALLFAASYFKFWMQLPWGFKPHYMAAAVIYVGSALGFEMLEALEYTTHGGYTFTYVVLTSVEEMFEMGAIVYVIYTNMRFLSIAFRQTMFYFSRI